MRADHIALVDLIDAELFMYTTLVVPPSGKMQLNQTILDKLDHHGTSTIMLMNRSKIEELVHHHENKMIIHAEFPESVHLIGDSTFLHLFN